MDSKQQDGRQYRQYDGPRTDLTKKEVLGLMLSIIDQMEDAEQRAEVRSWVSTEIEKHGCCYLKIDVRALFYNKPDEDSEGVEFGIGAPFIFGGE